MVINHREIAEQLLAIFQAEPTLLVDHSREIMEFLTNLRTLKSGGEDCYTHLVSSCSSEHGFCVTGTFVNLAMTGLADRGVCSHWI